MKCETSAVLTSEAPKTPSARFSQRQRHIPNLPLMDIECFFFLIIPQISTFPGSRVSVDQANFSSTMMPCFQDPSNENMCTGPQRPLAILCGHFNWAMVRGISLSTSCIPSSYFLLTLLLGGRYSNGLSIDLRSVQAVLHAVQLMQHLNATT